MVVEDQWVHCGKNVMSHIQNKVIWPLKFNPTHCQCPLNYSALLRTNDVPRRPEMPN